MREVGRATSAEHTFSARGSRRIEADGDNVGERNAALLSRHLEPVGDLLEADVRSLGRERGMLAQAVEEELSSGAVEQGEIHGRAAQVDSCDNRHAFVRRE